MSLYDNGFGSSYEELKTFYPVWYWNFKEMDAIWQYGGGALDDLEKAIDRFIDNNFVMTADEKAIERLEVYYSIPVERIKPLDERRRLILSYMVGFGKFSATKVRQIVAAFTSAPCEVDFRASTLYVVVTLEGDPTFNRMDCYSVLLRRMPAHLRLSLNVVTVTAMEPIATKPVGIAHYGVTTTHLPYIDRVLSFESTVKIRIRMESVMVTNLPEIQEE